MISYENFTKLFNILNGEHEFEIYFKDIDETYMIIKYKDNVTFQKCGNEPELKEIEYNTIDDLYNNVLIDNICLKNDWDKIEDIIIDSSYSIVKDLDIIQEDFNISF